jgi:hypothetical protein
MADLRQILTDKAVARLPYAEEKQYKVRDTEVAGFFVLIGKRKKSFMARGEFWRDGVREFAVQDWGVRGTLYAGGSKQGEGCAGINCAWSEAR